MKRLSKILLLFLALMSILSATTRRDINIIQSSENIRYLSQELVTTYLLFYKYPQAIDIVSKSDNLFQKLDNNLKTIAMISKNKDIKDILEFLAYSRDQIDEIIKEPISKENVSLVLDYGETFIEGANSIRNKYQYKLAKEEEMLVLSKKTGFYINRATKYYIADNIGFDSDTNQKNMTKTLANIEKSMKIINEYPYPYDLQIEVEKINRTLSKIKPFLKAKKEEKRAFIPMLMIISTTYLDDIIDVLAIYHTQNQ